METPIPDAPEWYAACLLMRIGDSVRLAELRILPNAGRWKGSGLASTWSSPDLSLSVTIGPLMSRPGGGDWSRKSGDLRPEHVRGLTSRMLRKVPLDSIVAEAWRRLNSSENLPKGWDRIARNASPRPGRAGRDEHFYAVWAKRYADRVEKKSKSPTRDLAEMFGERYGAVAQWIHEARTQGLLSRVEGQQGRRGGFLTPKAVAILGKDRPSPSAR